MADGSDTIYSSIRSQLITACIGICLLYNSDAADEEDRVDLGGRRIINNKIQ